MHIWAANKPVDAHNEVMLDSIDEELVTIIAHYLYPTNISDLDINKALERGCCSKAGLDYKIELKVGARVMLTTNIDVEDRLINGQIGTVTKIRMNRESSKPEVIYVQFDNKNGKIEKIKIRISGDPFAITNGVVTIMSDLGRIKIKENGPSFPEIQITQFPLALAWACTVHTVQGLTLPQIVVSFELFKQRQLTMDRLM